MKPQEALNHFKEQICKHCCKWDKSLRHCNDCPTGIAIKALEKQATSKRQASDKRVDTSIRGTA